MNFELLKTIVGELSANITNARVAKIHQPAADMLIFRLWNGKENLRLLISANPESQRIHLTETTFPNPFTPPRFCQLLRARISRLLSIGLLNDDRIVGIECSGPKGSNRLIIELTGKNSNMVLVDSENVIIDALHRFPNSGEGRNIVAGQIYQCPVKKFVSSEKFGQENALLLESAGQTSANDFVDNLYPQEQTTGNKSDLASILLKALSMQRKKLARRLEKIIEEQNQQANADYFKRCGECLLVNLHQLKRGQDFVELTDYFCQPPEITKIVLNPRLSPQENAERYFKLFKKAKRGIVHSSRRLQETEDELLWLESLEFQVNDAATPVEVESIATECRQAGLLKNKKDRLEKKQKKAVSQPLESTSPNGFKIYWGRSNRQNDFITTKLMKNGDLWFHANRLPGAHVLLKGDGSGRAHAEGDILYAAAIAAGYSKGKANNKVEVLVAEPKHVLKPNNARPGLVTIREYKTLMVKPIRLDS